LIGYEFLVALPLSLFLSPALLLSQLCEPLFLLLTQDLIDLNEVAIEGLAKVLLEAFKLPLQLFDTSRDHFGMCVHEFD
jgi:hypothetical protein